MEPNIYSVIVQNLKTAAQPISPYYKGIIEWAEFSL